MEIDDIDDIYANLPAERNFLDEIEKLQEHIKQLEEHAKSLEGDIEKLCAKIVEMKKIRDNLAKNISELYKTAKAEIDRKDKIISELRAELEQYNCHQRFGTPLLKRPRGDLESPYVFKKAKIESDNKKNIIPHRRSRSRSRERHRQTHKERSKEPHKIDNKKHTSDRHKQDYDKKSKMNSESGSKNKIPGIKQESTTDITSKTERDKQKISSGEMIKKDTSDVISKTEKDRHKINNVGIVQKDANIVSKTEKDKQKISNGEMVKKDTTDVINKNEKDRQKINNVEIIKKDSTDVISKNEKDRQKINNIEMVKQATTDVISKSEKDKKKSNGEIVKKNMENKSTVKDTKLCEDVEMNITVHKIEKRDNLNSDKINSSKENTCLSPAESSLGVTQKDEKKSTELAAYALHAPSCKAGNMIEKIEGNEKSASCCQTEKLVDKVEGKDKNNPQHQTGSTIEKMVENEKNYLKLGVQTEKTKVENKTKPTKAKIEDVSQKLKKKFEHPDENIASSAISESNIKSVLNKNVEDPVKKSSEGQKEIVNNSTKGVKTTENYPVCEKMDTIENIPPTEKMDIVDNITPTITTESNIKPVLIENVEDSAKKTSGGQKEIMDNSTKSVRTAENHPVCEKMKTIENITPTVTESNIKSIPSKNVEDSGKKTSGEQEKTENSSIKADKTTENHPVYKKDKPVQDDQLCVKKSDAVSKNKKKERNKDGEKPQKQMNDIIGKNREDEPTQNTQNEVVSRVDGESNISDRNEKNNQLLKTDKKKDKDVKILELKVKKTKDNTDKKESKKKTVDNINEKASDIIKEKNIGTTKEKGKTTESRKEKKSEKSKERSTSEKSTAVAREKTTSGLKDKNPATIKEKNDESPESHRVLRSATRRSTCKEKSEKPIDTRHKESNSRQEVVVDPTCSDNGSSVNLTHEGDIPVLHIAETDHLPKNLVDVTANINSYPLVTTSSSVRSDVDIEILKQDLNISVDDTDSKNLSGGATDVTVQTSDTSNVSSKSQSNVDSAQRNVSNVSSVRKRRRVVITMID